MRRGPCSQLGGRWPRHGLHESSQRFRDPDPKRNDCRSRLSRYRWTFIGGREKVHIAWTRPPLVYAITGAADFPATPASGTSRATWLERPCYVFRSSDVVRADSLLLFAYWKG